ncbi:hypothetical protein G3R49_07300 [Shewanella sp. WXL01]|uniref:hypothetical protein n=1 Tax=Shewanella sp. WXL01 TaxID=2709721 RepID=UPI00143866D0|nr:hypothetical protein [Shewanella sp. WXL01]NKF50380.1 hypothetical protein [Shewanella sp. WXL01]
MKKSLLTISVITALLTSGCSSDEQSTPTEEIRTIEVSTNLKNVSNVNALSSNCLPVGDSLTTNDDVKIPVGFEHPVCAIKDNRGFVHYVRTNDYQITITDSQGTKFTESIADITNFQFEFDVVGEAVAEVHFIGELEGKYTDVYSYYTVETPSKGQTIDRSETNVKIEVDNEQFSYVTFQSHNDDVIFQETTITTEKEFHFGLTGQQTNNSEEVVAYRYIKQDADVLFTARNYEMAYASIEFQPQKHFDFGVLEIDPNEGSIIITPPRFGNPIDITPTPIDKVINPDQVLGATIVNYEPTTGAATFEAQPKLGKAEPSVYPEIQFEPDTYILNQFDFNFDVETSISASTFMNIYLIDVDSKTLNAVVYPTGNVTILKKDTNGDYLTFDKFEGDGALQSFMIQYGEYTLASQTDSTKRQTNFILRVADDNKEAFEFTINEFTIELVDLQPLEPIDAAITEKQLIGADIKEIDLWTGNTTIIGKHNARISAVPTLKFPKGAISVKDVAINFDVTAPESELSSDVPYVNIYLENGDTYDLFIGGINDGKVIKQSNLGTCDQNELDTKTCYNSFTEFQAEKGEQTLRNWAESGKLNTNFVLRVGDSNDNLKDIEAKVNSYSVNLIDAF